MSDQDFACPATCKYAGKPWPQNLGKPTCRLFADYRSVVNPVTKAVIRSIIRKRIGYMGEGQTYIQCEDDHGKGT